MLGWAGFGKCEETNVLKVSKHFEVGIFLVLIFCNIQMTSILKQLQPQKAFEHNMSRRFKNKKLHIFLNVDSNL